MRIIARLVLALSALAGVSAVAVALDTAVSTPAVADALPCQEDTYVPGSGEYGQWGCTPLNGVTAPHPAINGDTTCRYALSPWYKCGPFNPWSTAGSFWTKYTYLDTQNAYNGCTWSPSGGLHTRAAAVAFLQDVLLFAGGASMGSEVRGGANYGCYSFYTTLAVKQVQTFFNLPNKNGVMDAYTWSVIDNFAYNDG